MQNTATDGLRLVWKGKSSALARRLMGRNQFYWEEVPY